MGKGKSIARILILVFLGLILFLNIAGLLVELLIQVGVINIESVNIKGILSPTLILSLAFVVSGIVFWTQFYKNKKKVVVWWNIFMATTILIILSKLVWPTILVELIPYYFFTIPYVVILIWLLVFRYLKKAKTSYYG